MNGTEIEIDSLTSSLWFNLDIGVEEAVFLLQLLLVEQLN